MLNFTSLNSLRNQQLIDNTGWNVIETDFNPNILHHKETVFTLGNGYLGTRGTFEEGYPNDCATTMIHGVYDDVPISYTELANCPDWLPLVIKVAGSRFGFDQGEIIKYERRLDLLLGVLNREVRWRSPKGHTVDFHFERFTSLADKHILAIRCQITPVDFQGEIEVEAFFNAEPDNQGVKHWQTLNQGGLENTIWLESETIHSGIQLGMAAQLNVDGAVHVQSVSGSPVLATSFQAVAGQTVTVEKIVTVFTSRDTHTPLEAALHRLAAGNNYITLLAAHITAWARVWHDSDVIIEGDLKAQLSVRYNIFQLMIAAPRDDDKVSIGAKTLSGFAYRGHVFWDTEIFLLPFLSYTQPEIARNLLTYRYHTLAGARRKAREAGCDGAMFPWESAVNGNEVTPRWVPGPKGEGLVRIWCGDIELHITADIAYAVWQYWQTTGDDAWMRDYGAEIFLDTAVFWGSRAEWNPLRHCYEINDVIGPDEYHEHVDNNAFTNVMAQWHLESALALWDWLKQSYPDKAVELKHQLDLTFERLEHWVDVAKHIHVSQNPETGLIEQCDGFFKLKDVNLADYDYRTKSMQALLGIEETNERQILKQPDALMLLYLLRDAFGKNSSLRFDNQAIQTNWDYYTPRTDHTYGSSLGPAIHGILACNLGNPAEGYTHFMRAALVDLEDVRRNAAEGIHAASTGGVWQAVVFGFGGVRMTSFGPMACPQLPEGWTRLKFRLQWRNEWYEFDFRPHIKAEGTESTVNSVANMSTEAQPAIKGVIFDLDGVLTDTAEFHYLGWKRLADEEGIPFDQEMNESLRGLPRRESLLRILGDRPATEAQIQEMMERKNRYYVELMQSITPAHLLPGVSTLLQELRDAGVKIALGSSSKNAQTVIQRLGIAEKLDAVADGYSVHAPKPAPDVFLFAAEQLGLPAQNCIVVEDAEAGVAGALAAGMAAVGLGPVERVGKADVVLPNLEGIRWQDLQAKVVARNKQTLVKASA